MHTPSQNEPRRPSVPERFPGLLRSATALGVVVLATALLWLLAPEHGPYVGAPLPLQALLGSPESGPAIIAALQALVGAATTAVGLASIAGRTPSAALLGTTGIASGAIIGIGFVGFNGIAVSGYLLALALPVAVLALSAILIARRRVLGALLAALLLALVLLAILGPIPAGLFYEQVATALPERLLPMLATLLFVLFAGVWLLCGALAVLREPGRFGAFVRRHRIAITVLAACCSLPYAIARASWLTPWPLFGGEEIERGGATVLATGLMLGAALLLGGVLTLGLILPWGTTFPRLLPRIGGRPVPVPLAVVPAVVVAALFTAGGAESLLVALASSGTLPVAQLALVLVLPFWLWGPLLGLAAWGYAQHRSASPEPTYSSAEA
ncbi:hypothetical protein [Gulosibacter sp. 10]|uniref:hypothetical protein n=1 Tax=Gulosibacter sp. 10 TaxID=1255570 RepID=UPI0011207BC8|nr:hypothetical protein [Gulosibacter sp. 10]